MARPARKDVIVALLDRHVKTFAQELGIRIEQNTPSPLFRMLVAAVLFSARISAGIAVEAARALTDQGWTTPEKMADSTWSERARTLNQAGYARYDEKTSSMLGENSRFLLEKYKGDLRNLREEAKRDPENERQLLKAFKGIGDTGVDIFFREAQAAWNELFPFADGKALRSAAKLGLPDNVKDLARMVDPADFPRLIGALVRVDLAGKHEDILRGASGSK